MPIRTRIPVRTPESPFGGWARATAWVYFALLCLLLGLSIFLWKSGSLLVRPDKVEHVRWAAVLAGEGRDMERTELAARLFQDGRFDSLIVSGPRVFKTHHASEFASELLGARGFPKDRIFQLPHEAYSTLEEAGILIQQARLLAADTLLVITSNYHSARARRIFRQLSGGYPVVFVAAAEAPFFDPKAWWSSRESRAIWLTEWIKTVYASWELWRRKPLTGSAEYALLEPNPREGSAPEPNPSAHPDSSSTQVSQALPTSSLSVPPSMKPDSGHADSTQNGTVSDSMRQPDTTHAVARTHDTAQVKEAPEKKEKEKEKEKKKEAKASSSKSKGKPKKP